MALVQNRNTSAVSENFFMVAVLMTILSHKNADNYGLTKTKNDKQGCYHFKRADLRIR